MWKDKNEVHPEQHTHQVPPCEDEVRLEKAFKALDLDGNGKVDVHDLSVALKGAGVHHLYAQKFLDSSDLNKSGDISLKEFIHYVKEHEKNLKLVFTTFDKNRDGRLDPDELVRAFRELHIDIDHNEAVKLVQRMDTDGSLNVSFDEWRDFLLYAPSTDVKELIKYWRHSSAVWLSLRRRWEHDVKQTETVPNMNCVISVIAANGQSTSSAISSESSHQLPSSHGTMPALEGDDLLPRPVQICQDTWLLLHEFLVRYLDIGEDLNVPDDFTATEMKSGMWWRHLVAGGVAGAVSRTCTAPLDRLKVYLQVHGSRGLSLSASLRHLLQEGGTWSLWRGNGINVLKIAPESAIKFMAYEQAKRLIRRNHTHRELSIYERFAAGSMAGGISQTVIYPLEVMKTRLALRKTGEYKSIVDAARKMYAREGWRSFYRGYVPNLLGIIPYAGIDLAVYETLKNSYIRQHSDGNDQPSVLLLLACGTASSTCGQVCSYPLALVRTQLQAKVTNIQDPQACSMVATFRGIVQKEGLLGLYRGLTPNFLKVVPAVSISYVVYERCRQALGVDMT